MIYIEARQSHLPPVVVEHSRNHSNIQSYHYENRDVIATRIT